MLRASNTTWRKELTLQWFCWKWHGNSLYGPPEHFASLTRWLAWIRPGPSVHSTCAPANFACIYHQLLNMHTRGTFGACFRRTGMQLNHSSQNVSRTNVCQRAWKVIWIRYVCPARTQTQHYCQIQMPIPQHHHCHQIQIPIPQPHHCHQIQIPMPHHHHWCH